MGANLLINLKIFPFYPHFAHLPSRNFAASFSRVNTPKSKHPDPPLNRRGLAGPPASPPTLPIEPCGCDWGCDDGGLPLLTPLFGGFKGPEWPEDRQRRVACCFLCSAWVYNVVRIFRIIAISPHFPAQSTLHQPHFFLGEKWNTKLSKDDKRGFISLLQKIYPGNFREKYFK